MFKSQRFTSTKVMSYIGTRDTFVRSQNFPFLLYSDNGRVDFKKKTAETDVNTYSTTTFLHTYANIDFPFVLKWS